MAIQEDSEDAEERAARERIEWLDNKRKQRKAMDESVEAERKATDKRNSERLDASVQQLLNGFNAKLQPLVQALQAEPKHQHTPDVIKTVAPTVVQLADQVQDCAATSSLAATPHPESDTASAARFEVNVEAEAAPTAVASLEALVAPVEFKPPLPIKQPPLAKWRLMRFESHHWQLPSAYGVLSNLQPTNAAAPPGRATPNWVKRNILEASRPRKRPMLGSKVSCDLCTCPPT